MNLNRKVFKKNLFRICSYNTLADFHIKKEFYPYCNEEFLYRGTDGSTNRHQLLMKELDHISSDINCLQEVDAGPYVEYLRSEFAKRNHNLVFEKKNGDTKEGLAITYDNKQFQCIERRRVAYYEEICKFASKNSSIPMQSVESILKSGHIALICIFKSLQSGEIFIVGNTHIKYGDLQQPDLQILQACIFVQHVYGLHEKYSTSSNSNANSIPIIICGDFNSEPDHYLYALMKKHHLGCDEYEDLRYLAYEVKNFNVVKKRRDEASFICEHFKEMIYNPLSLKSSYEECNGSEPTVTSADGSAYYGTVDYIFVSPDIRVVGVLEVNDEIKREYKKGGPSSKFASDHLPLAVDLFISPN